MLYLSTGHVSFGVTASITSSIGIYDVLINFDLQSANEAAAVSTCENSSCTVWGDRFANHSAWAAAFYERFANGPQLRSNLLVGHVVFNSMVFVLMYIQLFKPGYGPAGFNHKILGRVSFAFLTIGLFCAVWLASEHAPVAEYGGRWTEFGFYSIATFVYGAATMGIIAIRSGDCEKHRIWMYRFVGSMSGSFLLFRVILFVIDPLLRNYEVAALLIVIWASAPLGIIIAEVIRRHLGHGTHQGMKNIAPGE